MASTLTPKFGSLVPTQQPQLLDSNYLQWNDKDGDNLSLIHISEPTRPY